MTRRTKILATLGPATDTQEKIEAIIAAGANVVRMNFSHGQAEDHIERAKRVRAAAAKLGKYVAILGDLQGPKIRVSRFANDKVFLNEGDPFVLDAELDRDAGNEQQVGIDYKALPDDVSTGDILLLDDGRIQLEVTGVDGRKVLTKVTVGGKLSNNKGINRLGGGLSAEALTEKDKRDILTAAEIGVDYLAVSFPRSGADLNYARELAEAAGCKAKICAKVERAEAVATDEAIDDIISASDAVMVARGDLGVEIGDAELVGVQKKLIARSRQLNKVVITATQMMESMIESPMPTRAEVMDVANAVLDGTDAVMLSAETAAGSYPVETVKAMARVCEGAETHPSVKISKHRMDELFGSVHETIALSAVYAANHLPGVKAIVGLTESGSTPRLMSRITTTLPIVAMSRHEETLNLMALYRGVKPVFFDSRDSAPGELRKDVVALLKEKNLVEDGDIVILTHGDRMETIGATDAIKIIVVE
ncbi:pyruvate kinase [Alteromonas oceani]|jgi:pyruvate kinase|uniref:Pyruvate kinase n=2 Tax=Alteromonas TaxID=226 RepID=A0A2S9VCR6_9ALTE|nr:MULTISPECIES: pyruvate kinase [Alteromonas]HAU91987.1 pyruvate kinase [Alteromonas sp.]PRO74250.1 pyruvate kinase [Alteromonas alba]HCA77245.1 pyruvate kinase [Alteromonas sp.]HCB08217.1 pyruvate kinase [Alteromonas sp.]HCB17369.1 pyruvate kinase [Alteromonas sp.]|tara:strand:- start:4769 stop:6205 length:1437 start_codon:yes stop_codon:yes gene_type:complete